MEFRHLKYFVTVAAERSFSRASEKLHMAQPPLSRQIKQLEEELGTQLLNRGRPITLTEAGRFFLEQAQQMLQLAKADDDGRGAGKTRDDRVAQKVNQEAQPDQSHAELDKPDQ